MRYLHQILFLIFILLFCSVPSDAQIWLSNQDIYDEAGEFLNAEDFEEALPLYLLLEKKEIISANIQYKIGTCYLNIRGKKDKALPYLKAAVQNASLDYTDTFPENRAPIKSLLMFGIAQRINNQPEEAIGTFEILKDSIADTNPDFMALVDLHIKRCENAITLGRFSGKTTKDKLPEEINNVYSNYNPVLVNHEKLLYYMEELKFYDAIMEAHYENGDWSSIQNITPAIGSDGDHYLVSASADGSQIFLYYYATPNAGEIYSVHRTPEGWSELLPLNENINTKYHETHASIASDGKTLFFTSNRPGGFGGLDIYLSKLDVNNDWGPAINLGPSVNTPYNEESPFISVTDSILYFSSQGQMNMGGYDVFYSVRQGENKWSQPVNMGVPVSTTDDDLFYFPMTNGLTGLMSRLEAPYNTSYDIYRYQNLKLPNPPRYRVKGSAEGVTAENASSYSAYVVNSADGDTIQKTVLDRQGGYDLLLPAGVFTILVADKLGHIYETNVNLENAVSETIELSAHPVTLVQEPFQVNKIAIDTFLLKDILFAFDDITISPEYSGYLKNVLDLMRKYPEITLQLTGYADALGEDGYNLMLSKKRSLAVSSYMVALKLEENRLELTGKGEVDPVAVNQNADGTDCPEGRKYNRRVVLKPIGDIQNIKIIEVNSIPENLHQK